MKFLAIFLAAVFIITACTSATPILKVDDLWAEREKSKAEFQAKYTGKDIVVAGRFIGDKPTFDFKNNTEGFEEINVTGSSWETVQCQIEEKDAAGFKHLVGKGEGIAVKGKLVSGQDDAYPELRPCTIVVGD